VEEGGGEGAVEGGGGGAGEGGDGRGLVDCFSNRWSYF